MLSKDDLYLAIDTYIESKRSSYEKIEAAHKINETLRDLCVDDTATRTALENLILEADYFKEHQMQNDMVRVFDEIIAKVSYLYETHSKKVDIPALVAAGLRIL